MGERSHAWPESKQKKKKKKEEKTNDEEKTNEEEIKQKSVEMSMR